MESGNKKIKSQKKPKEKKPKSFGNKILNVITVLLVIGVIGAIVGGAFVYIYVSSALDGIDPLNPAMIQEKLVQNSVIVDSEGRILETIQRDSLRTVVTYDQISPAMIDAIVSVEDKTFWDHNGFNIIRMFGAVKDSLTTGKRIGGTSTITQQLARNVFLFEIRAEREVGRKIQEAYYAIELEKHLTKRQIIEAYLNLVSFGNDAQGIEAAAQTYFSKSAAELDYIESAILAGMPKGPSLYSPMTRILKEFVTDEHDVIDDSNPLYTYVFNDKVVNRYLTSLYLMHQNGYISNSEYEYGKTYNLKEKLNPMVDSQHEISSFFADMVKDEVISDLMAQFGYTYDEALNILFTGGFVIESTIDFDMQKILESHYAREDYTPYYGESTVVAIRNFQRDQGLTVDGSSGPVTLGKLSELSGVDFSDFSQQSYNRGTNHDDVVLIKTALFKLGYMITNENFPKVTVLLDSNGNIISEENRRILLYQKSNLINESGQFFIKNGDYSFDDKGNLVLKKNKNLHFYPHYQNGELSHIQLVIKDTFTVGENALSHGLSQGKHNLTDVFSYQGRDLLVPNTYKSFDSDGNVVIDRLFLSDNPDFFKIDGNQNLTVDSKNYVISNSGVIQPQSAMVIMDYHTGELKAVVGGRNISGQRMFNRATNPRQPGSAIKPLSVFSPAIDSGKYTAATVLDDRPVYLTGDSTTRWPVNWYEAYGNMDNYRGLVTLREQMEQSINVTATLLVQEMGVHTASEYLEKYGITTLVKEGPSNDMNLAALALGGMTRGISPVELTSAYGAIANKGVLNEAYTYKTVRNRNGDIFLEKKTSRNVVVDENVAFIIQDMMRTGITSGVASRAKLSPDNDIIPVSGKTGTTSSNIDAWFVGYTPYYVGGVWFGNDVNIPLDQGSRVAASFWREVMSEIHSELPPKNFEEPSGIVRLQVDTISGKLPTELSRKDPRGTVKTEIFLRGTEPTEEDDVHVMVDICTESGKLAGPYCPITTIESRFFVKRPIPYIPSEHNNIRIRDMGYDMPTLECDIHNESSIFEPIDEEPSEEGPGNNGSEDPSSGGSTITEPKGPHHGVQPKFVLSSGVIVIQRPYPIILQSGQTIVLPANSRIQLDGSITLADGSSIPAYNIKTIPEYTADELDVMNPTP